MTRAGVQSYDAAAWNAFFYSIMGATAALTGLLFVAVANNLPRILKAQGLAGRAAETLATLLSLLVISALALVPQSTQATGGEILPIAAGVLTVTLSKQRQAKRANPDYPRSWHLSRTATTTAATLPATLGGLSLALHAGGGFYWLATAALLGVTGAAFSAWVLLIEILR